MMVRTRDSHTHVTPSQPQPLWIGRIPHTWRYHMYDRIRRRLFSLRCLSLRNINPNYCTFGKHKVPEIGGSREGESSEVCGGCLAGQRADRQQVDNTRFAAPAP
jgi:hypothetical protein